MENALVPVATALVAATTEPGRVKNVFRAFRAVFAWPRCRRRKIYWFENRWGRTIVRQVMTPEQRVSKREDRVLATIPGQPNMNLVKLVIANSSRGQILTGVAWELYDAFQLGTPVACGRFDYADLLPHDPDQFNFLLAQHVVPVNASEEDWDFDGLLLTHRCRKCFRIFAHEQLVFDPEFMQCPCGYRLTEDDMRDITIRILRGLVITPSGVVPRKVRVDFSTFLDIHATSALCNCVKLLRIPGVDNFHVGKIALTGFSDDHLRACYQLSLLPLLKNEHAREAFLWYVGAYYERRLAGLPDGDPLGKDPELVRQLRITWLEEERAKLLECIQGFEDFETWYFLGPELEAQNKLRWLNERRLLNWLPGFLEDFIIDLGERLLAEERTVPA